MIDRIHCQLDRASRVMQGAIRDIRGVAAVEFGLLAPILLLMFAGCIEIGRAVAIDRRVGLVTSLVADMVAREQTMSAANLNAIYNIAQHIMSPYDASALKLNVIPVQAEFTAVTDPPTEPVIFKVYAETTNRPTYNGATAPAACADYSIPTGLLQSGERVIVVESSYDYTPLFLHYTGYKGQHSLLSATTWADKAILSPRQGSVDFDASPPTCF